MTRPKYCITHSAANSTDSPPQECLYTIYFLQNRLVGVRSMPPTSLVKGVHRNPLCLSRGATRSRPVRRRIHSKNSGRCHRSELPSTRMRMFLDVPCPLLVEGSPYTARLLVRLSLRTAAIFMITGYNCAMPRQQDAIAVNTKQIKQHRPPQVEEAMHVCRRTTRNCASGRSH